jgi:intein/homing endonuclease
MNYLKTVPGNIVKYASEITDEGSQLIIKLKQGTQIFLEKAPHKEKLKASGLTDNAAETAIECAGDGCFTGNTLVLTKDGYKRIDEVQQGELVFSKNVETGNTEFKKVAQVYIKDAYTFVNLTVGNEIIRTTPVHLFYTVDGEWKEAVALKVGDRIVDSDGSYKEISTREIQYLEEPERIFNLNVEDYHTYFVGSNGLLVHNTRRCTPQMIQAINASRQTIANIMVNNISQLKNHVRRMVDCGGYIEVQDLNGNLMHIDRTDILDANSTILRNTEIEIRQNMRRQLGRKDLAGKRHPDSGVLFDSEGYPVFDTEFEMHLDPKDYLRSRGTHFNRSSKAFYNEIQRNPDLVDKLKLIPDEIEDFRVGDVPERFTWHHHQDTGKMQLVDYNTHRLTGHDGGYSVWGPGN